ncbi:MAG: EamA family transporter [Alphaproteobacteria bacterium]|nr:EamA family transporter [Alphaproteobacteria bacterium]MBU1513855.1 EamA family transporter [Alphaproteobacteria bacterium]MBU2094500.1 EamA family transporter [Alphaproteobacteria bacterium]MBU2151239.1 EamA family transporter [Alphaproteobacteria bacterium]MBU2305891.1 EamA family transporter [Alphaproteobacteria bacterium]
MSRPSPFAAFLPFAAVIGATCAFQVGASLAKSLFPLVGPQGAAALRLILGAAMLMAVLRPWRRWPGSHALPQMIGLGLATAGAILFFYLAIGRLPQGVAIALQFLGPLGVAIAGSRRASDLVWAALAAAGVWGLVGHGLTLGGPDKLDLLGVAFALAAAASWAAYIVWGQAASRAFGQATPALAVGIATLVVVPVGVQHAGLAALLQPSLLPLALLVALISTAIPFSLEMYALPRMPARTFAVLTSLEPAFGALAGLTLLHERLAPAQLAGVCAVMAAAAGAAWSGKPPASDIPPT